MQRCFVACDKDDNDGAAGCPVGTRFEALAQTAETAHKDVLAEVDVYQPKRVCNPSKFGTELSTHEGGGWWIGISPVLCRLLTHAKQEQGSKNQDT
jgi:hypothetical protein